MKPLKNDEPAFPQSKARDNGRAIVYDIVGGMSLRDWMAGMALQGWLASFGSSTIHPVSNETEQHVAEESYAMADAMIAARKRKEDA